MKKTLILGCAAASAGLCFAVPHVDQNDVTLVQSDATRKVTVTYTLTGEPGIVTMDVETNAHDDVWVPIGDRNIRNVSGAVNVLVRETGVQQTIFWQPDVAWPGHVIRDNKLRVVVKAWATNAPPDYMVVDLATKRQFFYTSADALPFEGGVTNRQLKTDYLVMRKIPAAEVRWRMGAALSETETASNPRHYVTLSTDYYMSVFEFTRGQFVATCGAGAMPAGVPYTDDAAYLPMVHIDYATVRGQYSGALDYPTTKTSGGKLTNIRNATGLTGLDLPTDAQWEYACRAGRGTAYYCEGRDDASVGRIANYGKTGSNNTMEVGSFEPNAWGLYDMCGNVLELCLDRYWTSTTWPAGVADVRDPVGPTTDVSTYSYRVTRGGSCSSALADVSSSVRGPLAQGPNAGSYWNVGFRLCCPAVVR